MSLNRFAHAERDKVERIAEGDFDERIAASDHRVTDSIAAVQGLRRVVSFCACETFAHGRIGVSLHCACATAFDSDEQSASDAAETTRRRNPLRFGFRRVCGSL
jgi:hypothetical protein